MISNFNRFYYFAMLTDDTSLTPAKKALTRRTQKTIENVQQEKNSASILVKKISVKRI